MCNISASVTFKMKKQNKTKTTNPVVLHNPILLSNKHNRINNGLKEIGD